MQAAEALRESYSETRQTTERICSPLLIEDHGIQSMSDVSPPKWHLAHTSWLFENFILVPCLKGYRPFHPQFSFLFNSYYEGVGQRVERHKRGLLSRPTLDEVHQYRAWVDRHMRELDWTDAALGELIELGVQHEQQHQELLLMDIKHIFHSNPLRPAYQMHPEFDRVSGKDSWTAVESGVRQIGHGLPTFAYDNEKPRHSTFIHNTRLRNHPVLTGEFLEFIEAGGYHEPRHWLSDGWAKARAQGWEAPLYWEKSSDKWEVFTLGGTRELDPSFPVSHVSYYEADAFARWKGATLPTEAEWECAAEEGMPYGQVWEWTQSAYLPYPGYRPFDGGLSEYNGKFMSGQMVMRGKSCATPQAHLGNPARHTYRNFFPPESRWQFGGFRIASS